MSAVRRGSLTHDHPDYSAETESVQTSDAIDSIDTTIKTASYLQLLSASPSLPPAASSAFHASSAPALALPNVRTRRRGHKRAVASTESMEQQGTYSRQATPAINATTATMSKKTTSRSAPYPYQRRASAPSVPSLALMLSPRPDLRSFQSGTPTLHHHHDSSTSAVSPMVTNISGSLPSSLPLSIPSNMSTSPSMMSCSRSPSGAGTFASSSLPRMSMADNSASLDTNQYIEHWHVHSKEAAKQINDLTLLMSLDQSAIVTFQPHSYIKVLDAEVGQHNWFRAQACTCPSYKVGFDKVRRPATIRDHLAKQPCAPHSLARLAEIQLRLMRASSKRTSQASIPDAASPRLSSLPEYSLPHHYREQQQYRPSSYSAQSMHTLFGNSMNLSPSLPFPANNAHPASPAWMPLSHADQIGQSFQTYTEGTYELGDDFTRDTPYAPTRLEQSRSWPTSSHFDTSSPFFGWSTDSEHAPSSASMSTNNSGMGSSTGLSLGSSSHTLNMNNYHTRSDSLNFPKLPYSLPPDAYQSSPGALSADQPIFDNTSTGIQGSDSPLFGAEESLFSFDDM